MSAEIAAVRLGTALVTRAGAFVMSRLQTSQDTQMTMDELIRRRIPGIKAQRSLRRQFEQISDAVAERLEPMIAHEYRGMEEGERQSVVSSIIETFESINLSDDTLLESNADPAQLARIIRANIPDPVGLSESGTALYNRLLAECCDDYVRIVRHLPVFTERAIAEILSRVSTLGEQVSKIITRLPARSLYSPEGSDHDSEFLSKYLEYISSTLDDIEVFSFGVEKQLSTKLSMAYISLRVVSGRRHRASITSELRDPDSLDEQDIDAGRLVDDESSARRIEAILKNESRILLRGEAGSGKTTLLRWLAITAARGAFTGNLTQWNGLVPILIKLRSYGSRPMPKLNEILDDSAGPLTGIMPRSWIDRKFRDGHVLLLVDGVDELSPSDRRSVRSWLQGILGLYPTIRVVVTSRPAAASQDWLLSEEFLPVHLERMDYSDLRAFIRNWHQAVASRSQELPCSLEDLPIYERAMVSSLSDRPHLYSLASNPLLAAMLCSLNLTRFRQLPRNRMELYQIAVELLVQRRDADRQVPSANDISLSLTQKLSILRDLAWRLSDNNRSELALDTACRYVSAKIGSMPHVEIEPEEVVSYLLVRSGILRSPAVGRVDFVHRTFQEYLAAGAATEEDRIGNLVGRAHLDLWRETIVMAAGHANRAQREELICGILERAAAERRNRRKLKLLAVSCMETMESTGDVLDDKITTALDDLVPPRRYDDAYSLALLGETVRKKLPSTLERLGPGAARATVRTAVLLSDRRDVDLLSQYALDKRSRVHQELANAWNYFDDASEYATEVLSKIDDRSRLRVDLWRPSQWLPAMDLKCIAAITVNYPVNFKDLKFNSDQDLISLQLNQLAGRNDIKSLSTDESLKRLHSLGLDGLNSDSELTGTSALGSFEYLRYLTIGKWSTLPNFKEWTLPATLRSLRIDVSHTALDLGEGPSLEELYVLYLIGANAAFSVKTASLYTLKSLALGHCDLSDCLDSTLASTPNIERLLLHDAVIPEDCSNLSKLPKLTTLNLFECTTRSNAPIRLPDSADINLELEVSRTEIK